MGCVLPHVPRLWKCLVADFLMESMMAYEPGSPYCHGDAWPRYNPSTRCNWPPWGRGAPSRRVSHSEEHGQQTAHMFVYTYRNSIRFRPSKPAAATRPHGSCCPQNMCQQMAVMQKPLLRDGSTGWRSVPSRNTCSAATAHPFPSPTGAGHSCGYKRIESDGAMTDQWPPSLILST